MSVTSSIYSRDSSETVRRGRFTLPFSRSRPSTLNTSSSGSTSRGSSSCDAATHSRASSQASTSAAGSTGSPDADRPEQTKSTSSLANVIPLLRRNRSTIGKSATPPPQTSAPGMSTILDEDFVSPETPVGFGRSRPAAYENIFDPRTNSQGFGVQVSISAGEGHKARKPSFAEKAARFGKGTFSKGSGGGSARAPLADRTNNKNNLPAPQPRPRYMAVRSPSRSLKHYDSKDSVIPKTSPNTKSDVAHVPDRDRPLDKLYLEPIAPLDFKQNPESQHSANNEGSDLLQSMANAGLADLRVETSSHTLTGREALEPKSHFSWTTYAGSTVGEEDAAAAASEEVVASSPLQAQRRPLPVSHFSWTTAGSDTTYQDSDVPGSPLSDFHTSIMTRRRPVPPVGWAARSHDGHDAARMADLAVEKTRAASTSHSPSTIDAARASGTSPTPSTNDKALPLPPTTSTNHIEKLVAQQADLELRQANTQRVISELLKVENASPLEVTERMRRENKKKLEDFQAMLEDLQREYHIVGMSLTRARCKADREEGADSPLWLRRVTG